MRRLSGGFIALMIAVLVIVIGAAWAIGSYNGVVGLQETVTSKSADIDTQLQRRADLIPNLVNTVKGYAQHETEIMTAVSDARTKLAGAQTITDKANADQELSGALSRLMMIVENYPDLKADTQYTALMDELAGTENRVAVARNDYNQAAKNYNQKIKTFPTAIFANMLGFQSADYFQAAEGTQTPPTVDFTK